MTASGHALIGAAIVTKIPDLRIAIPLILVSHIVGDALPHWDTGSNWRRKGLKKVYLESAIDISFGYLLVAIIFLWWLHSDPAKILLGVIASQFFDFLEFPYFFLRWKFAPWDWINNFNTLYHKKLHPAWGLSLTLIDQIILSGLFILWSATK